jgi:hypothetical protein
MSITLFHIMQLLINLSYVTPPSYIGLFISIISAKKWILNWRKIKEPLVSELTIPHISSLYHYPKYMSPETDVISLRQIPVARCPEPSKITIHCHCVHHYTIYCHYVHHYTIHCHCVDHCTIHCHCAHHSTIHCHYFMHYRVTVYITIQ